MSRKKVSFQAKDVAGPPADEQWLWFTAGLLRSDAWLTASRHLRRLLDFLHVEHLHHNRQQNGRLLAPYADLVKFGVGRRFILKAITEGEERGLIEVDHGLCFENGKRAPSLFRVTYLPAVTIDPKTKAETKHAPTNEWRHYVAPKVASKKPVFERRDPAGKVVLPMSKGELGSVHDRELGSESKPSVSAKNQVHDREPGPSARTCTTYTDSRGAGDSNSPVTSRREGDEGRTCSAYVTNSIGYRMCGRPLAPGADTCSEHAAAPVSGIRRH